MNSTLRWYLFIGFFAFKVLVLLYIFCAYSFSACLSTFILYNVTHYVTIKFVLKLQYTRGFEGMYSYSDTDCYVTGVIICEKFKSIPAVLKRLEEKFVNAPWNTILKQRLVSVLGDRYWTLPEGIVYEDHVKIAQKSLKGLDELNKFLCKYTYEPVMGKKPKWEIMVFPNYENNQSAVLLKISHAYGDGLAFCNALFTAFDDYKGLPLKALDPPFWYKFSVWLFLPIYILSYGVKYLSLHWDKNGIRNAEITNKGTVAATKEFDVEEMKVLAKKTGNTINELIITICMKGVEWYLKENGRRTESSINVAIPVKMTSFHKSPVPLRQDLSMLAVKFPYVEEKGMSKADACYRQLEQAKKVIREIRGTRLAAATRILFSYIYYVLSPELISRILFFLNKKVTMVISNMAGPVSPLHLCGSKMIECLPVIPVFSTLVCNFAMGSYQGKMRIICTADSSAVPDPEPLLKHIETAYSLLSHN